jgi:hypothetical protein
MGSGSEAPPAGHGSGYIEAELSMLPAESIEAYCYTRLPVVQSSLLGYLLGNSRMLSIGVRRR